MKMSRYAQKVARRDREARVEKVAPKVRPVVELRGPDVYQPKAGTPPLAPMPKHPSPPPPAAKPRSASTAVSDAHVQPQRTSPLFAGGVGNNLIAIDGQNHHPKRTTVLGPVVYHRCKCGPLIVESLTSLDRRIYWIPISWGAQFIDSIKKLEYVLKTSCWHHNRELAKQAETPLPAQGDDGDDAAVQGIEAADDA